MTVTIISNGIGSAADLFRQLPELATQAMATALNEVATRSGLAMLRKDMREQINFPKGYLEANGRLRVRRKANKSSLEAIIRGRDRPTSLARFAAGQTPETTRKRPVQVQVKTRDGKRWMRRAFLLRLKNNNVGLAVRLKDGEELRHSEAAVMLEKNVYLLYGPSVDQVFSGVSDDRSGDIAQLVERAFLRHFKRFANG